MARLQLFRRELSADCETPLSIFARLKGKSNSFLFESAEGGEHWGRYSIIGFEPSCVALDLNGSLELQFRGGSTSTVEGDILGWLKTEVLQATPCTADDLPFTGGAVGFLSYEMVRRFEPFDSRHEGQSDEPVAGILLIDRFVVFDGLRGTMTLCVRGIDAAAAEAELNAIESRLTGAGLSPMHLTMPASASAPQAQMQQQEYEAMVNAAKEYILAGDIFQVVLSQRFSSPLACDPLSIYRAVRHINPSPYLFYVDIAGTTLVGSSPEILVRQEGRRAIVRPIAGTRPRGKTESEDLALENDLLSDTKELAEHVMLVDLGRNDLGRVCEFGSVAVSESMVVERYSHVMHIVSEVQGNLRDDVDCLDLLAATFPAGTVSGAPKIRAMQIIDELEPFQRGPYAGIVGYIAFGGEHMDTCIAIRTAVIRGDQVHVQAGAGIVADSVPTSEHHECVNKATAMFRAVALAESQPREDNSQ
ncbi:MAG TPA: anthranilate synthase component I [Mariprofundaceae bacterium]|nr:anthranilate synthase component I [Mariprofundaceae bacterium]